jgi:hypothetical protein
MSCISTSIALPGLNMLLESSFFNSFSISPIACEIARSSKKKIQKNTKIKQTTLLITALLRSRP